MKILRTLAAATAVAALSWLGGCGGGGGIGGTGDSATGTMRLSITDAPACGYDAVNITVDRIRVNQSASAGDGDAGWSEIVLDPAQRIDLLSLRNGIRQELGQVALPAGKYTQMRLVLAANDGTDPPANSVVPTGGSETPLTTPSGQQSGIKLNVDLDVPADKVADFVLDFDACKSIVKRGNSGQYNLKPVIAVTPVLSDAGLRVVGYVDPAIALPSTIVSVQSGGQEVKATVPDPTGKFVLYPVPVGNYDLVVSSAGHVTAVMTDVPVVDTSYTYVNDASIPIDPPLATMRTVTGTVAPATATVLAQQTLTGGPTVQVAWPPVDADTGAFSLALPIGAPVVAAYAENPTSLSFTADAGAAGFYDVVAASDGATLTKSIDVSKVVAPLAFSFP